MQMNADASERLVLTILAAQVATLRGRAEAGTTAELLWRATDVLSRMSALLLDVVRRHPALDPDLDAQCAAAVQAEGEFSRALDDEAFMQAQREDFTRQMADCVVTALERLTSAEPAGGGLSPGELAAMYVCEDQRLAHESATRKFGHIPSNDGTLPNGRSAGHGEAGR